MQIDHPGNSVVAKNGVVTTSQPLAAQAGLKMLKHGGNAVDAAIATAVALTVVEPTSNGIGGDAFAIVWDGKRLQGLNASGKSPLALSASKIRHLGHQNVPEQGWLPVTVPGAPSAWKDLHERYGRLSMEQLFEPAIEFAENGFEVSPIVALNWQKSVQRFIDMDDPSCANWLTSFTKQNRAPESGEHWSCPDQVKTFKAMLNFGIESFYKGDLAKSIVEFSRKTGGYLSEQDLASHRNIWVEPVYTTYRGVDVYELPPNGQGLAALIALSILEEIPIGSLAQLGDESLHMQIEAMKLGCVDAYQYISDPADCRNIESILLNPDYIEARAKQISKIAGDPDYGTLPKGGTVYLCAADSDGMMVSYIQSNYQGFGSGVVIPGTGIAMQNRGACFSLDPVRPNVLAGGKRCFHTIIPGFLMKDGKPLGPFGVMGGFMQPQGHLQVVSAMIDYGLDPQAALDMPRWRIIENTQLEIETGIDQNTINQLRARGHEIKIAQDTNEFGKGQIILRTNDTYLAGSDSRADGLAVGY